jgi:hypothetical protein
LSTDDAIGFVRKHRRISEDVQRAALKEDGVRGIVTERADVERMATAGRLFKARHVFLFADPRTRKKAGGWRKDLMAFIARMDKKGAVLKDVDLQLRSDVPGERVRLIEAAIEQLASNGRTTHLDGRRQGRKALVFTADEMRQAETAWNNRKLKTWAEVQAKMPNGFTVTRAYRLWGARK